MTPQDKITPTGRMGLPMDIRKRHGLAGGGAVYIEETDDGIGLRTVEQAVARAQAVSRALLEGTQAGTVAEFINKRRRWQE